MSLVTHINSSGLYTLSTIAQGKPLANGKYAIQKPCKPLRHTYSALKVILNQFGFLDRNKTRAFKQEFHEFWKKLEIVNTNHLSILSTIRKINEIMLDGYTFATAVSIYFKEHKNPDDFQYQFFQRCINKFKNSNQLLDDITNDNCASSCLTLLEKLGHDTQQLTSDFKIIPSADKLSKSWGTLFHVWSKKLGFNPVCWNRKSTIEDLNGAVIENKYLYAFGYFSKCNYKSIPKAEPFHESKVIFFNEFDQNPLLKKEQLKKQAIVIVGAIEWEDNGTVLYIDPSDGSSNQPIYGITYSKFCEFICSINLGGNETEPCYLLKYKKA